MTELEDILWEKQRKYIAEFNSKKYYTRFHAFKDIFNYFEKDQTVAQIACGSINEDLFHSMERIGPCGKIILIEGDPEFIYNRALTLFGRFLEKKKEFYTETAEGKVFLKNMFLQCNIEVYTTRLPPYPAQVKDNSVNHIMAINAAFELMSKNQKGDKSNIESLIVETYKKLKKNGSFIVQGILPDDIHTFRMYVYNTTEKNNLHIEEDFELPESLDKYPAYSGYWGRWIKK